MIRFTPLYLIVLALLVVIGCSSNSSNPAAPAGQETDLSLPMTDDDESQTNRELLGIWTMEFDLESLTVSVKPNRDADFHYNVKPYLPAPGIILNAWDPVTEIVDVDVELENPYDLIVWDVRLIIYTDAIGHELLNGDNWTALYDIPGGSFINPFMAYAKFQPIRRFPGLYSDTQNLQIHMPGGISWVQFAIDASIGGSCKEPYEITGFVQDPLGDYVGATAAISVEVFDWQDDIDRVYIECEDVMGPIARSFYHDMGDIWISHLSNDEGVPAGEYPGRIWAYSEGSGSLTLHHCITVTVNFVVEFPDPNLEQAIRDAIDKPTGDIYKSDLLGLSSLGAYLRNISNLEGLQHCINLDSLHLFENQIIDITPLADLTNLTTLNLDSNTISDITPLTDLTNLTTLYLGSNTINDIIPLMDLRNLTWLRLSSNTISDITPLEGLKNLGYLDLGSNTICDITPLEDLADLVYLYLSYNQISDIAVLAGLTNLSWLYLSRNAISDITPLEGLTNLTRLYLGRNTISDITPLADLTNLTILFLTSNTIIDITPLAGLKNLTVLNLVSNAISDITPLERLEDLTSLRLTLNTISDITPLKGLTDLIYLYLDNNQISDITALEYLATLGYLKLSNNQISDITTLEGLINLNYLYLNNNNISDIYPLVENAGLATDDYVNLEDNPLSAKSIDVYIPALQDRGVEVVW